jgi:alkylation response protein AidB-like acyl-CoA dehydrogenase
MMYGRLEESQQPLPSAAVLLQTKIAPQAEVIDRNVDALRLGLQALGNASLLALRVPRLWGGTQVEETTFHQFQELVARYSGALAFVQAQHQSAGAMLSRSDSEDLKQLYLPKMGNGAVLVGIAFAHLRREISPLKAMPVAGGYRLQGQVPWVTGFGFFQFFIVAASLPNNDALYGIVPFQDCDRGTDGCLICSSPMSLAAMPSSNTVSVQFQDWYLPQSQVLFVTPVGNIQRDDQLNVLNQSFFALGNVRASLDILERMMLEKPFPILRSVYLALAEEFEQCRSAIYAALHTASFAEKLSLRAWAIELAGRCAHAAVTVSSGSANLNHHPAQRVYREALLFTVSGQTTAVMEATLARLMQRIKE